VEPPGRCATPACATNYLGNGDLDADDSVWTSFFATLDFGWNSGFDSDNNVRSGAFGTLFDDLYFAPTSSCGARFEDSFENVNTGDLRPRIRLRAAQPGRWRRVKWPARGREHAADTLSAAGAIPPGTNLRALGLSRSNGPVSGGTRE